MTSSLDGHFLDDRHRKSCLDSSDSFCCGLCLESDQLVATVCLCVSMVASESEIGDAVVVIGMAMTDGDACWVVSVSNQSKREIAAACAARVNVSCGDGRHRHCLLVYPSCEEVSEMHRNKSRDVYDVLAESVSAMVIGHTKGNDDGDEDYRLCLHDRVRPVRSCQSRVVDCDVWEVVIWKSLSTVGDRRSDRVRGLDLHVHLLCRHENRARARGFVPSHVRVRGLRSHAAWLPRVPYLLRSSPV